MARENDDAGPTLLAISIFVLVLVLTTTALRITVRANRRALGGDDYTIAAASLLTIGRVTCQIISVQHGNGRHREFLSIEDYQYVNFLTWLTLGFALKDVDRPAALRALERAHRLHPRYRLPPLR